MEIRKNTTFFKARKLAKVINKPTTYKILKDFTNCRPGLSVPLEKVKQSLRWILKVCKGKYISTGEDWGNIFCVR